MSMTSQQQLVGRSKGQPRMCPFCNIEYANKVELTAHLAEVHGTKQHFVCHLCGKALSHQNTLNMHIATHTGKQNFECDICGKRFNEKRYYVSHMNKHAGSKPFQCKACLKSFLYTQQLSKHKKVCEGSIPLY